VTTEDHEPGCVWAASVSDAAGGGELVVLVLGRSTQVPWRFACLTLLNTTHLDAARAGAVRDWPLASDPWKRIL
jgi:hypothetical protein